MNIPDNIIDWSTGKCIGIPLFGHDCDNYLCIDCGWNYLRKYQQDCDLSDEELYSKLKSKLKKIYTKKQRISYSML